ncbi:MAG: flagellar protein FlaG [Candidatus Accumulibacter sp.]|jgi:flagellar protein FlaG|nr:flagellar protein FlaG [Accumulibacter sp.]
MDINDVASRAVAAFTVFPPRQQKPAGPAPDSQAGTFNPVDATATAAAASSRAVQIRSAQVDDDPSAREEVDPDELQKSVENIQKFVSMAARDIKFSIDEDSGQTVVKVVDRETEEVIRQIPSEEMLDLAQALDKLQGLLIKQKA